MEIFIENIQDKIEITDEILELMEKAIKMCLEHEKFEYPYEVQCHTYSTSNTQILVYFYSHFWQASFEIGYLTQLYTFVNV